MSNGTAKLTGMGDPVKDKEIPCTGMIKIGRDEKINSCPVKHASVSRQHAQIFLEAGNWMVEDMKSTNGVFVNESKISAKTPLKNGDVVRVGDIPFKFTMDGMIAPAAPKPAAPPPVPKPAAPPPVPRPAPKKEESGGGGEDLFEPSIVGGADMGAAIRAAQAEGAKGGAAHKPAPPPAQEGEFEGTMYGPQVARQLVKAIREEKEHQAEAAAHTGDQVARPIAGPKVPNMFLLKIKAIIFGLVLISGLGYGVYALLNSQKGEEAARKVFTEAKTKVDAFDREYEEQALPKEGAVLTDALEKELAKLKEAKDAVDKAAPELQNLPDWTVRIKKQSDRVAFLMFERNFRLALAKDDRGAAESVLNDLVASGISEKSVAKLGKLMVRFYLFHRANPLSPKEAVEPPKQAEVEELKKLKDDFDNEYRDHSRDVEQRSRFFTYAKDVNTYDVPVILNWDKFWLDYKDYESQKEASKLESLKKNYPNLKMLQAQK